MSKYIVTVSTDIIVEADNIYQAEGMAWDKFCDTFDEDVIINTGFRFDIRGNE